MPIYTITYLNRDGSIDRRRDLAARDDDHAIDLAGRSDHPHEMDLHLGERRVGRFPCLGLPPIGARPGPSSA